MHPRLRAIARELHLAVFKFVGNPMQRGFWPQSLLYERLEAFGQECGHPELEHAPLFLYGHSNGTGFSAIFPATESGRVWGWVSMRPGITFQVYQPGAAQVPGLVIFGEDDHFLARPSKEENLAVVPLMRKKHKALWNFAVEPKTGHGPGQKTWPLVFSFLRHTFAARVPADADPRKGPVKLHVLSPESGYLGQNWDVAKGGYQDLSIAPYADFTGDKSTASWLVNAAYAADWQAFQRDGQVAARRAEPVPFPMDWANASKSVVDLSRLLDAPAGKDGFITTRGPHLVRPDGTRFRIWGVNLCGPDCFPDHEEAPLLAADLARLGVNCVRFHFMDVDWGQHLFEASRDDTRRLDMSNLDRLDFFIAELKRRGIYTNLNLNVGRRYKAGDGVRDWQFLSVGKYSVLFNERLIELQQEFARQLLTHRNPYTGREYRHEPAVAVVEIVNENSLVEGWQRKRLGGKNDTSNLTWTPMPVSYAEELRQKYRDWLATNSLASSPENEVRFYVELEERFHSRMKQFLRDDLGVQSLVVGNSDYSRDVSGYPRILPLLQHDIVDAHDYWQLAKGDTDYVAVANTPMVSQPLRSTAVGLARSAVLGRPFTVSESNHPFPNEYACEGMPILTAYAMLQDWDGIYWFTWGRGRRADAAAGIERRFRPWGWAYSYDFSNDPMKVASLAVCGLMWHRRDVATARQTLVRRYTREAAIATLFQDAKTSRPFFTPGFDPLLALRHATRFEITDQPQPPFPSPLAEEDLRSDTEELAWNARRVVTVNTPRTQALVGFLGGASARTTHLIANVSTPFCTVIVTSLDGEPIESSQRLLLLTTSRCANSQMQWDAARQKATMFGSGPTCIEPVTGTVTLRGLTASDLNVQPLTAIGSPASEPVSATRNGDAWEIEISRVVTTWYGITCKP